MFKPSFLRNTSVPASLEHMSGRHYSRFVRLVEGWLNKQGHVYVLDAKEGYFTENYAKYGLTNIAQICHQAPTDTWPALIEAHFSRLFSGGDGSSEPDLSFDSLKSQLKLRISSPDLRIDPGKLVRWPMSPYFYTYLVIDKPEMTTSVTPTQLDDWQIEKDDLWRIALDNIWDQDKIEPEILKDPPFAGVHVFEGDHVFITSHAFMIERHFKNVPELGFLLAIPNRHVLIAYPIESPAAVDVLASVTDMAAFMYQQGPGSITDHVFWYRHGSFELFEMEETDKGLHLIGPGEFIYVVAQGHGFSS